MLSRDAATERLLDAKDDADIRFDDLATTVDRDPVGSRPPSTDR
jgi:hypothetical protein